MNKPYARQLKKSLIIFSLLLFSMPLSRLLSPTEMISDNLVYVCYLPYGLSIAALYLFGRTAILPLYTALFLAYWLAFNSFQLSLGLTLTILTPILFCGWLTRKKLGWRWRYNLGNSDIGIRLLFMDMLAPLLTRVLTVIWGRGYAIPEDTVAGYFSSNIDLYSILNLQILIASAVIFTPLFYFPLRMLANPRYAKTFYISSKSSLTNEKNRLSAIVWCAMLASFFLIFLLFPHLTIISSYLVPLIFILFAWGIMRFSLRLMTFLWACSCYLLMYFNLEVLSINSIYSLTFASSTFIAFTISLLYIASAYRKSQWMQQAFYRLALTDPMVQRANLRALSRELKSVESPTLCYLYLDNLKFFGRHYGIQMRVYCKRRIIDEIKASLGEREGVYQIAGDGLIILLEGDDIAQRLRQLMAQLSQSEIRWQGNIIDFNYASSFGSFTPAHNDLYRMCGQLCYLAEQALHQGGLLFLDDTGKTIADQVSAQVEMLKKIKQAIAKESLVLFAQPIVSAQSEHRYYEVLCRLRDDQTIIMPSQFMPLVTECHLSARLDQLVVKKAAIFLRQRQQQGKPLPQLAINLLPATLTERGISETLCGIFKKYHLPHENVLFEVTEEQYLFNQPTAINNICQLRNAGFRIAIDDFGTGFANYEQVKRLNVDVIKIDGMFIKDLENDRLNQLIVKSICEIAREKKLCVVAEYVETPEQQRLLTLLGVDYLQGYLLGQPGPLENIA